MKFGVFLPNGSNGYAISSAAPLYRPTYAHNLAITREAERQGLDFVLSMTKFKGFGGETGYWDAALDSLTLTAALAAATSRIELIGTAPILALHPAIVARIVATIDDVSQGRCALNIVTGWSRHEYAQMGLWPGGEYYESRYDYAAQYIGILRDLWRHGSCTFDSQFFNLKDCVCEPRPQREVPIVCAGQSPRGMTFTAQHGEFNFTMAQPSELRRIVERTGAAAEKAGRKVGTFAYTFLVARDTDAEAAAEVERVAAAADRQAIANMLTSAALDTNTGGTSERLQAGLSRTVAEGHPAFGSAPVIFGSHQSCAQQLADLAETGLDGVLFAFLDYMPDLESFGRTILPMLSARQAGETAHA
jgi:pyrimidine oxygenase